MHPYSCHIQGTMIKIKFPVTMVDFSTMFHESSDIVCPMLVSTNATTFEKLQLMFLLSFS